MHSVEVLSLEVQATLIVDMLLIPRWFNSKETNCQAGSAGSFPGLGRSLEKEMGTHSSILAWKIPWTEEPGGIQSPGVTGVTKS